jgi:hypothetical protein
MWPFARRQKDLNTLPSISSEDHKWSVAEASYEGSPLIVRLNSSAQEWLGHKALPIKLGFAVPLNAPNEGGLPQPDENKQLNDVEDVILREVEAKVRGIYALVLTTGTMREFVFYIVADADIKAVHDAIRKSVSTHEVQCMAETDPKWATYAQFARK